MYRRFHEIWTWFLRYVNRQIHRHILCFIPTGRPSDQVGFVHHTQPDSTDHETHYLRFCQHTHQDYRWQRLCSWKTMMTLAQQCQRWAASHQLQGGYCRWRTVACRTSWPHHSCHCHWLRLPADTWSAGAPVTHTSSTQVRVIIINGDGGCGRQQARGKLIAEVHWLGLRVGGHLVLRLHSSNGLAELCITIIIEIRIVVVYHSILSFTWKIAIKVLCTWAYVLRSLKSSNE